MRIAIVGSGIAGLTAAAALHPRHDVALYEAEDWVGGHTHTVDVVDDDGSVVAVDTGFIVCNDWTYPRFLALLARAGVATQPSNMSFSLQCERSGLEYNGTSLNALFAQRRNLLRPGFLRMLAEILRFNRAAPRFLRSGDASTTLAQFLADGRYAPELAELYLVPMGRAIWSASRAAMLGFPARFFIDFFHRHGFLNIDDRPQWRTVAGGSREYVRALTRPLAGRIRTATPVESIVRRDEDVIVRTRRGDLEHHDALFLATHADTALALLADPTPAERAVLDAFPYAPNEVTLHTDTRLLPRAPLARAAWNFHRRRDDSGGVAITYDMNVLQSLQTRRRFLVSLNLDDRIDPRTALGRWNYAHPVYTPAGVAAQARQAELNGARRTFYCGAYWRHGFHEDGVVSAEAALEHFAAWAARHDAAAPATAVA
jgi:predicted NAD/FAD-binding protein